MKAIRGFALVMLAALLAACGGGNDAADTPGLASLPTRTPSPPTVTLVPGAAQVVSLAGDVRDFLASVGEVAPLDQSSAFVAAFGGEGRACFGQGQTIDGFGLLFDFTALAFPLADFTAWQQAAETLPEQALIDGAQEAILAAYAALPSGITVRLCVLPVPAPPEPVGDGTGPVAVAVQPLKVVPVAPDTLLVACSGGDACLDGLQPAVVYAYGVLYQQPLVDRPLGDMTLLERMIVEGRAAELARRVYPDAVFPWDGLLTPQQSATAWIQVRNRLDWREQLAQYTGQYLWSPYGDENYPAWSGIFFGDQMVRAYRALFPDLPLADLMALDPPALYRQSRYLPDAS